MTNASIRQSQASVRAAFRQIDTNKNTQIADAQLVHLPPNDPYKTPQTLTVASGSWDQQPPSAEYSTWENDVASFLVLTNVKDVGVQGSRSALSRIINL